MIEHRVDQRIATITLNRPEKLHAMTVDMLLTLERIALELDRDPEVRVILITSTGDRAFCVGADINAWTELSPIEMWRRWTREGQRVFDRVAHLRQPVIAILNGLTLGGGLELALAADIRLAGENVQVGLPEVKLATVPGWGGTQRLPRLIGIARAKQMIFSGEQISAKKAYLWGLVNEVHPGDELMARALQLANEIADNAPVAVQLAKQMMNADSGYQGGLVLESLAGALSATTEDAAEGKRSFRERRSGHFSGR